MSIDGWVTLAYAAAVAYVALAIFGAIVHEARKPRHRRQRERRRK